MNEQKIIDSMLTLQTSIEQLTTSLNNIFGDGELIRDFSHSIDDFSKSVKEYKEAKES